MNELIPSGGGTAAVPSVFDDFEVFEQALKMAAALSKSKLVPEAFRGSPESCLIAIDLSRRLRLSPFTLLPHLYVIDSKPAFSAQFLITLVNRSGKFERLDWETGEDGETSVHFFSHWNDKTKKPEVYEEKVKNYWAVAVLAEKRSGKKYRSPRIDVAFAERNGWTSKSGSKWKTMPELMCAYRSASILIRRTCPELTLGLDAAEDVADSFGSDAPEESPEEPREVMAEPRFDSGADPVAIYKKKIAAAADRAALEAVGREIAAAGISGAERDQCAEAYTARQKELCAEEEPERDADHLSPSELLLSIKQASTLESLDDIRDGVESERRSRIISAERRDALIKKIADRRAELEAVQDANAESFAAELEKAGTREDVQQILSDAAEFKERGILAEARFVQLQHAADEIVERKSL